MPADPEKVCHTYSILTTCVLGEMERLVAGTAVVRDWVAE